MRYEYEKKEILFYTFRLNDLKKVDKLKLLKKVLLN